MHACLRPANHRYAASLSVQDKDSVSHSIPADTTQRGLFRSMSVPPHEAKQMVQPPVSGTRSGAWGPKTRWQARSSVPVLKRGVCSPR